MPEDNAHPVKCLKCGFVGDSNDAAWGGELPNRYMACPKCGEALATDFTRFKGKKFPMHWPCLCGSTERVIQEAFKQTHNGREVPTAVRTHQCLLAVPEDVLIYSVILFWDVCANCGREYIFKAEMPPAQLKVQAQAMPTTTKRIIIAKGGNN